MVESTNPERNHSIFLAIKDNCERIVNETQSDLALFRQEQDHIREQIYTLMANNRQLSTKLDALKSGILEAINAEVGDGNCNGTSEAIDLLQKRIANLKAENNDLRALHNSSRKTIEHLELEINSYRDHVFSTEPVGQIARNYKKEIKDLQDNIEKLNKEKEQKNAAIEKLIICKKQYEDYLVRLQSIVKEKNAELNKFGDQSSTIKELQERIQRIERKAKDAETALRSAKAEIEDRFQRERNALQKVKEALSIAEVAVVEKEEAENKHQILKEEWDTLASSIGQVMEEAAKKADKNMEELRQKFLEKEKYLKHNNNLLNAELEKHNKLCESLESRCQRLEKKYKDACKENERLKAELDTANKVLEQIINSNNVPFAKESLKKKQQLIDLNEVQGFLKSNNELKEKYKNTIKELTDKFANEISRLTRENTNLKTKIGISDWPTNKDA